MDNKKELNSTYWRLLFVPVVLTILLFITLFVFLFTHVGLPHSLINKAPVRSPNVGS